MNDVHGAFTPLFETVYNWINEFKRDRISTRDGAGLGRPVKAAMPDIIKKVHDMIINDQRVKVGEIVDAISIYHAIHGTVITISHEKLPIKKFLTRWVPLLLFVENKRNRVTNSMAGLALFHRNPSKFRRRYITDDKTCIHF